MLIPHKNFNSLFIAILKLQIIAGSTRASIENNPTSFICFLICIKFHFLMVMSVAIKSLEILKQNLRHEIFFKEFLSRKLVANKSMIFFCEFINEILKT